MLAITHSGINMTRICSIQYIFPPSIAVAVLSNTDMPSVYLSSGMCSTAAQANRQFFGLFAALAMRSVRQG